MADYAFLLAQALRRLAGIESQFVVANPRWQPSAAGTGGFAVDSLPRRESGPLREWLAREESPVLLHFTGYEYQRRGCPIWLWNAIRQWRSSSNTPMLTMLHEFSATGPPWTSSFWLGPVQHRLTGDLLARSTAVITNRESSRLESDRFRRNAQPLTRRIPIFSTIGEPDHVSPLDHRSRRMVVFGNAPWRTRAYVEAREALEKTARAFQVTEIADIGPPCRHTPTAVADVPVRALGRLESSEVLQVMGDSLVGFVAYPADVLPKSSIYNAYCTTGLVPVAPDTGRPCVEGITANEQILLVGQGKLPSDPQQWQQIVDAARKWYAGHSVEATGQVYLSLLQETMPHWFPEGILQPT